MTQNHEYVSTRRGSSFFSGKHENALKSMEFSESGDRLYIIAL